MKYVKPACSSDELVELMKSRGLLIADEAKARDFLDRVSFYRLKGYLLHFEKKVVPNATHFVPAGTTFDSVLGLYELDRRLRLLLFEAIERIEICFRSAICNTYANAYTNPHWMLETAHFVDDYDANGKSFHERLISKIRREIGVDAFLNGDLRERQIYVEHYLHKYDDPPLPPCWVLAECLSLGNWSQIFDKLAAREGQKRVAKIFQVPSPILGSWMHALSVARNICAHHGRVWNRTFVFKPGVLNGYEKHFTRPAGFYLQAFAAAYLLRRIVPDTTWHLRMCDAMLACPASEFSALGAFNHFENEPIWSADPLPPVTPKALSPTGAILRVRSGL